MLRKILLILIIAISVGCKSNIDNNVISINYNEVKEKNQLNHTYILYIGRKNCDDCHLFEKFLKENSNEIIKNTTIYNLDIQQYKENNETIMIYQEIKDFFSLEWVPSVYVLSNGQIVDKFIYLDSKYHLIESSAEKMKVQEKYNQEFKAFLEKNSLLYDI